MQALCRFIPAVALALALMPAPAQASRASACKAPPFSVPKETQRAVDAAIDARVTGTGAGGASARVAARTDYETTTLSQDAVASAWGAYTLCLKLAKKLISQDLHDELLRGLMAPPLLDPLERSPLPPPPEATASPSSPPPAPPAPLEALAGTWQVTSTFRWSTCPAPNDKGGVTAYSWLVSTSGEDDVAVAVLGATAYPTLRGRYSDGHLLLTGDQVRRPVDTPNGLLASDGAGVVYYRPRVFVAATSDGATLLGTRDFTTVVGPTPAAAPGGDYKQEYEICVVHFELEGRR